MSAFSSSNPNTVPLTAFQKTQLASKFLPIIFFVVALIASITVLPNLLGQPVPPLLPIFLVVVLLIVGYEASKSLRDLMSGVATFEEDTLERLSGSRRGSSGGSRHYGTFTQLGRMRLSRAAFHQAQVGQRCRIAYSPASRMVWSIEPII